MRYIRSWCLLAAFMAALLFAGDASAGLCTTQTTMAIYLKQTFNEIPVSKGLSEEGFALIVYASPSGATWTMVVVAPSGRACVIVVGTDWMEGKDA